MLKFLIADDHRMMREAIIHIIKDENAEVLCTEVENGAELISKLTREKYDLVVSDISMPVMNGIEALVALKKDHKELPVIIISIHAESRYAINALKAGASAFIAKPRIQHELLAAIRTVLCGKKYMTNELALQLGAACK